MTSEKILFGLPQGPLLRVPVGELRQPCVYVCQRGESILYVGHSKRLNRPIGSSHEYLRNAKEDDVITIWVCATLVAAKELERRLIETLKPKWNSGNGPWWRIKAGLTEPSMGWSPNSQDQTSSGGNCPGPFNRCNRFKAQFSLHRRAPLCLVKVIAGLAQR